MPSTPHTPPLPLTILGRHRRRWLTWLAGATVWPVSGCGGGSGNTAGLSTGGTGSFTNGTVNGLGSIIVNRIRYDNRQAQVQHSDGTTAANTFKLGMVVSVEGSAISGSVSAGTATATATRISYDSEWIGPVGQIDVAASTFTLLGNTVSVSSATVFDGSNVRELADLRPTHWVEVYGYVNTATQTLQATRVEVSTSAPGAYKLSGLLSDLRRDRCTLGALTLSYTPGQAGVSLREGMLLRVHIVPQPDAAGRWAVTRWQVLDQLLTDLDISEADEAELKGRITAHRSATDFSVNGCPVDARGVPGVAALGLTLGSRVEVKGAVSQGVVRATEVERLEEEDVRDNEFELHGRLTHLDTQAGTFTLRGYTVYYTDDTVFELNGALWAVGLRVEVDAVQRQGRWYATQVEADTETESEAD